MKTKVLALLMAGMMLVMSAAPAVARAGGPVRPHPAEPPGLTKSGVERPEQAQTPDTGRQNADHRNPCSFGLC